MVDDILKSAAGGFMICIGGVVYLSCDVKYIGAVLFSLGLFTICEFGLGLYTGRVGYLLLKDKEYWKEVAAAFFGNAAGTFLSGILVFLSRPGIAEKAGELCAGKLSQSPLQTLILSFFCGILMFIAVDTYNNGCTAAKYIAVFTAVPVFILSGFEHSVANMFYFFCSLTFSFKAVLYILICAVGNALGAISASKFKSNKKGDVK